MAEKFSFPPKTSTSQHALVAHEAREVFLPLPEVCGRIRLRKSWIYDAVQRGEFPKPIRLTPRRVAWRESDVEAWMSEKIAARDAG